mgnify:CR=1 FL=1
MDAIDRTIVALLRENARRSFKDIGTHVNLSGLGVVAGSDQADDAQDLIEFLVSPGQQQVFSDNNHEFPVTEELEFKADPIDVEQAGARLDEALNLMDEVGWD